VDEVQIGNLKQLAALETLQVSSGRSHQDDQWTPERLGWLCRPPHRLQQLQKVAVCDLSAAHLNELTHLPSLSVIDPVFTHLDALPLLRGVPNLRRLVIRPPYNQTFDWTAAMVTPHLLACAATLTDLQLERVAFSLAEIIELVQSLPLLDSLALDALPLRPDVAAASDAATSTSSPPVSSLHSLRLRGYPAALASSSLLPLFRRFGAALRRLALVDVVFETVEDLATLSSTLPQLETLKLHRVDTKATHGGAAAADAPGSFLRQLRTLQRLHSLTLERCADVTPESLLELAPLLALRSLTVVTKSMAAAEFKLITDMLTLPSALLPQLTQAFVRMGY
jgi:hypothetical protein